MISCLFFLTVWNPQFGGRGGGGGGGKPLMETGLTGLPPKGNPRATLGNADLLLLTELLLFLEPRQSVAVVWGKAQCLTIT